MSKFVKVNYAWNIVASFFPDTL